MKFTLEIQCDNEAFGDDPWVEISEILAKVARKMYMDTETDGSLFDSNGNKVGSHKLEA